MKVGTEVALWDNLVWDCIWSRKGKISMSLFLKQQFFGNAIWFPDNNYQTDVAYVDCKLVNFKLP